MKKRFGIPQIMALGPRTQAPGGPASVTATSLHHEPIGVEDAATGASRIRLTDILDLATNAWRARGKMLDPQSGEVREEMKRVIRHVDAILARLLEIGLEVKDHTGDGFDYGQVLKVVGTEPRAGFVREEVVETMKPTIYWQGRLVQTGEVVVGTPIQGTEI